MWVWERQAPMSVVDDSPAPTTLAALKATLAKLESSSGERLALDQTLKQIHQVTSPPVPGLGLGLGLGVPSAPSFTACEQLRVRWR